MVALVIAAVAHGFNMRNYPYYENDEGTYISQAWSLLSQGKLAPYTYWYDHAPAGWIFLAGWIKATGGLFTFGMSVDTGRVFMLVLHIASSLMLFWLVRKHSQRHLAAVLAVVFFSISPLAIYYHRRVLLDNIMVFWLLAAISWLYLGKKTLRHVMLSAVCFGIAALTKEVVIFFLPGMVYLLWQLDRRHRVMGIGLWLSIVGMVVGSYFLYGALKTELLPVGWLGDSRDRVSLLGSLMQQLGRGVHVPFWHPDSLFRMAWRTWVSRDVIVVWGGIVSILAASGLALWNKTFRLPALLAAGFGFFLLRNALVIDFYIVPIFPFAGWCFGLVVQQVVKKLHWAVVLGIVMVAFLLMGVKHYYKNENEPYRQAVNYIKQTLPEDSHMAIDASILDDLWYGKHPDEPTFANADWFWKVARDRDVFEKKLQGDWRSIDYIVLSHEMLKQIGELNAPTIELALSHADLVTQWGMDTTTYVNVERHISANGDWMAIYKVRSDEQIQLTDSWNFYKSSFIHSYGQIIDPQSEQTTSEGQAYAMLRAVQMNDQATFDGVWQWTRDHMQFRDSDKLLSWLWKDNQLKDSAAASDADLDTAIALAFASKRWNNPAYLTAAKTITSDIWKREVVLIQGKYYLIAGPDLARENGYLINPSYFSPAYYKIFSQIDPGHPWMQLVDDTYETYGRIRTLSPVGLMPNWLWIDKKTGQFYSGSRFMGSGADLYGFDAFRAYFRIAIDAQWFGDDRAKSELTEVMQSFFGSTWHNGKRVVAEYDLSGREQVPYSTLSTLTGPLAVFSETDPLLAGQVYREYFDGDGLKQSTNYYEQNWLWFGAALYSKSFLNLWK